MSGKMGEEGGGREGRRGESDRGKTGKGEEGGRGETCLEHSQRLAGIVHVKVVDEARQ